MKRLILTTALLITVSLAFAQAQQTTGTPGSPSATTTIDGKQLSPEDIEKLKMAVHGNPASE